MRRKEEEAGKGTKKRKEKVRKDEGGTRGKRGEKEDKWREE